MYQHLSETSKTVLKLAREKSRSQGYNFIGTEHVLMAILECGLGLGAQILDRYGVNYSLVEKISHDFARQGMVEPLFLGSLPVTPHFKNVIAIALEEAERFNDRKVGTEYLVLAILRTEGCIAEKILRRLAVKVDDAREMAAELQGRAVPYPKSCKLYT